MSGQTTRRPGSWSGRTWMFRLSWSPSARSESILSACCHCSSMCGNARWRWPEAGNVYLRHSFLVHAADWPHRGVTPRFMAQPELPPVVLLDLRRADADYSPVEIAVRSGLGVH